MHCREAKDPVQFRQEIDAMLGGTSVHHRPKDKFDFTQFVFPEADFSQTTFTQDANFSGAKFTQDANFSATFTQDANFPGATFTQGADFSAAKFTQGANFPGAKFTQDASFRAKIGRASCRERV